MRIVYFSYELKITHSREMKMETNFYDMLIANAKNYLRNTSSEIEELERVNAFEISEVLGIVLCKSKEEIILDLCKK